MITVLFTMKNEKNKCKVFFPAICTMVGMHLMSVGFGKIIRNIFSPNTVLYFAVGLFLFFGIMMLYEAYHLKPKTSQEKIQELEKDLLEQKDPEAGCAGDATPDRTLRVSAEDNEGAGHQSVLSSNTASTPQRACHHVEPQQKLLPEEKAKDGSANKAKQFCSNPYLQLVLMLFLADWGDRCQISAITLTASNNIWGVACGGSLGMAICVCLAVLSGAFLTNLLTEKMTTYISGVLFIIFGFQSFLSIK